MRAFLLKCMEESVFDEFFAQKDHDLVATIESLFQDYFSEAFIKHQQENDDNQEEGVSQISRSQLTLVIEEKFQGDENLQEMLNTEIEKFHQSPEAAAAENQLITDMQVKNALRVIL